MDLVSIVVNNKEPMEIILLTYFEIESTVMGFRVYQSNWELVVREVLKACMEPQNEVDKYAVAVVGNENNVIGHLPKGKSGKYAKRIFYFLKTDSLNICPVKITGKAVNLGDNKWMRISCLLQLTGNCKMMNILQELILNCRNGSFRVNKMAISVNFLRF